MSVKVRINGRSFLLSWNQFEKALSQAGVGNPIEVLDVVGGAYVAA